MGRNLTDEQVEKIRNNEWIIFATSDSDNIPHCIITIPSLVENKRIVLSNIQMKKSIENVKQNNRCFIDVYIRDENDKQIKIDGTAQVLEDGKLYEEVKEYEETNNLPSELKVNSIIVVEIESVLETQG